MSIEFRYDREKEVLFGMMTSPLTPEEVAATLKDITESDQFPPDIRTLWDLRELDLKDLDRSVANRLISVQKKYPQRGSARVAWIVANVHGFGMGRMYEALSGDLPHRMRVFFRSWWRPF